jgi:abnormal spindle-like microcephaly-associated protein
LNHRNKITSLLLSYSTPWLRLGLETVFGTVIQPDVPTQFSPRAAHRGAVPVSTRCMPLSRLKLTLKNFIVQNVLSDDKVLAKYTGGKCKVPSGSFEERYRAELRTIVLYRLLVLILFLDRAKMANVLEKAPNLFTRSSAVKSTRDVLLAFCRDFLKAEGDFVKHLSRVGLQVFYKQEAVDELDFTVTNLRVDLNDGVRLARMTELLTGAPLLQKLRLPAVSRLQKFHNVGLALDRLAGSGVPLKVVAPHHIVDGHREMVLKLLWSVIARCCLQELLTVEQVQTEIARIQKLHGMLRQQSVQEEEADLKEVLVQWCNVVCSRFGRAVEDLTRSFADGKAVCYLIHYYHPTLLRFKEIYPTSQDNLAKYGNRETLLSNEHANGILANTCMSELGGIPEMIPICDTASPPEEKSMLLCLTLLCSRLMESSVEIRACVMIQNCYRDHRNRILRVLKDAAAVKIWAGWRLHKVNYYAVQKRRYGVAVQAIEQFVSTNRAAFQLVRLRRLDRERTNRAAIVIQVSSRAWTEQPPLDTKHI